MTDRTTWPFLVVACQLVGCSGGEGPEQARQQAEEARARLVGSWREAGPGEHPRRTLRFHGDGKFEESIDKRSGKEDTQVGEFQMVSGAEVILTLPDRVIDVLEFEDPTQRDNPKAKSKVVKKNEKQGRRGLIRKLTAKELEVVWVYEDGSRSEPWQYARSGS